MNECNVNSVQKALIYITDCNLATVCDMAMKAKRPQYEYKRQISIAQAAVDWIQEFTPDSDVSSTRILLVKSQFHSNVNEWAKHFEPKKKE